MGYYIIIYHYNAIILGYEWNSTGIIMGYHWHDNEIIKNLQYHLGIGKHTTQEKHSHLTWGLVWDGLWHWFYHIMI